MRAVHLLFASLCVVGPWIVASCATSSPVEPDGYLATTSTTVTSTGSNSPCANGVKDASETDIDCGGSCAECADGATCATGVDCTSGFCNAAGVCAPCAAPSDCPTGQGCVAGVCGGCVDSSACVPGQICVGGACGPCTSNEQCAGEGPENAICNNGACGGCTNDTQCSANETCVLGQCRSCSLSTDCPTGYVCSLGRCYQGLEVQMYQCPGRANLGGGAWGYYGCEGQISSAPTCRQIEHPTVQDFPCTPIGKMPLLTGTFATPMDAIGVQLYQCPGITSLGGGAWGYYGCTNQITNTDFCLEIEHPTQQTFPCTDVGRMLLATGAATAPPGGQAIPMYDCPGLTGLGGGEWGYYGCQNQITNTPTCNEIEYPKTKDYPCVATGTLVLGP